MSRFARDTEVSVEKSQGEIAVVLKKYGAEGFGYFSDAARAVVAFTAHGRQVRFIMPLPQPDSDEVRRFSPKQNRFRNDSQARAFQEKLLRQKWRCLLLAIRAKLEAVESGITDFESEFMAHIVLPNGQTAGAWMRPQIEASYKTGGMPPMLLEGPR